MSGDEVLDRTVDDSGVRRCLDCGKCTAICPVARFDGGFSPRVTVAKAVGRSSQDLLDGDRLWSCLTCLQCTEVCPAGVEYAGLTKAVRTEARRRGQPALCTHGEAIHVWMRLMAQPGSRQNRLDWLAEAPDSRVLFLDRRADEPANAVTDLPAGGPASAPPPPGRTLFFAGCAPYYDALMPSLGIAGAEAARSSILVLNALGIEPAVLSDERCCGHDLLWEGDVDGFLRLARLNAALIRATGAGRIVSSCPECVRALKVDYPAHGVNLNVEVLHLSEVIAASLPALAGRRRAKLEGAAPSSPENPVLRHKTVTFHDPCRLGRHLGVYDAPRQVLEGLGLKVVEMRHSRRNATCCGTNGWTHCGPANKAIQARRLREARATEASLLVTACLKCQIHLKCALMDPVVAASGGIDMIDLASLVAAHL